MFLVSVSRLLRAARLIRRLRRTTTVVGDMRRPEVAERVLAVVTGMWLLRLALSPDPLVERWPANLARFARAPLARLAAVRECAVEVIILITRNNTVLVHSLQ